MNIAIFQSACAGLSSAEKIDRLSRYIVEYNEIERDPLDLVICPELFITGYNVGDELIKNAEPAQGTSFTAIARLCQQLNTAIVFGYAEVFGDDLHNSAAFVSKDGDLVANHRKQLNSPGRFEEKYFTPGDKVTNLEYHGLKIAILICYEVEFPESARNAAINGAQLIVVPTALVSKWDVVASKIVPTRAFENGVWLAYANHAGEENGFEYLGGSKIVGPDGAIIADAGMREKLISASINIDEMTKARSRLPYLRDFSKLNV